jgi:hypothetical protein
MANDPIVQRLRGVETTSIELQRRSSVNLLHEMPCCSPDKSILQLVQRTK